jgi:hypothetical protein
VGAPPSTYEGGDGHVVVGIQARERKQVDALLARRQLGIRRHKRGESLVIEATFEIGDGVDPSADRRAA